MNTEDKILLDKLEKLAEEKRYGHVAVILKAPPVIVIETNYWELHRTFKAVAEWEERQSIGDTEKNNNIWPEVLIQHMRKNFKGTGGPTLNIATKVYLGFSRSKMLEAYKEVLNGAATVLEIGPAEKYREITPDIDATN